MSKIQESLKNFFLDNYLFFKEMPVGAKIIVSVFVFCIIISWIALIILPVNKKKHIAEMFYKTSLTYLIFCFFLGAMLTWIPLSEIYERAILEVNGTIIESQIEYFSKWPTKPRHSKYIIEPNDGGEAFEYIAGGIESTLAINLPINTRINKNKWEIHYYVNDEIVKDFSLRFYTCMGCIGSILVIGCLIYLARRIYLHFSYGEPIFLKK